MLQLVVIAKQIGCWNLPFHNQSNWYIYLFSHFVTSQIGTRVCFTMYQLIATSQMSTAGDEL